jgi:hypothetical protein
LGGGEDEQDRQLVEWVVEEMEEGVGWTHQLCMVVQGKKRVLPMEKTGVLMFVVPGAFLG